MGNAVSSSDSAEGNVNDDEIGEEDARVLPIAAAAAVSAIQRRTSSSKLPLHSVVVPRRLSQRQSAQPNPSRQRSNSFPGRTLEPLSRCRWSRWRSFLRWSESSSSGSATAACPHASHLPSACHLPAGTQCPQQHIAGCAVSARRPMCHGRPDGADAR